MQLEINRIRSSALRGLYPGTCSLLFSKQLWWLTRRPWSKATVQQLSRAFIISAWWDLVVDTRTKNKNAARKSMKQASLELTLAIRHAPPFAGISPTVCLETWMAVARTNRSHWELVVTNRPKLCIDRMRFAKSYVVRKAFEREWAWSVTQLRLFWEATEKTVSKSSQCSKPCRSDVNTISMVVNDNYEEPMPL